MPLASDFELAQDKIATTTHSKTQSIHEECQTQSTLTQTKQWANSFLSHPDMAADVKHEPLILP
jgi:hypothetical protein